MSIVINNVTITAFNGVSIVDWMGIGSIPSSIPDYAWVSSASGDYWVSSPGGDYWVSTNEALLMESGDYLLLESGYHILRET